MSDFVRFEVRGTVQAALRFEKFPDELRDDLLAEMNKLGREAFERVAAAVPQLTGKLASQQQLLIINEPDVVGAVVNFDGNGANPNDYKKAGALEYGSKGEPVSVKQHDMMLDHVFARMLDAPMVAVIKAFSRTPNIAPDFFVRGPMAAMQSEALDRLQAVTERAVSANND